MSSGTSDDSDTPTTAVTRRTVSPDDLRKSRLYEGDETRWSKQFQTSIETWGVVEPIIAHVEDDELAVIEGWQRVLNAREAGKDVPVWIPEDGTWSDDKVLLARLLANTASHSEDLSWLRRAWLLDNLWAHIGDTEHPSPSQIAETLDVPEPTARRWLEPIRTEWNGTILDQDMFEGEQIRQADGSCTDIIEGLPIGDLTEAVNPSRLMDIRTIVQESAHRGGNRKLRVKLLNGYVLDDITYDELKELKEHVKREDVPAEKALADLRTSENYSVETTLEGSVAEKLSVLAKQTGKEEDVLVEEGIEELVAEEAVELVADQEPSREFVGQFDYLQQHVEEPLPEPDLRLVSNEHMEQCAPNSIALTVTSPPYNVAWEYGEDTSDNRPYTEYLQDVIREPFAEVYRLTVDGGYCCLVVPLIVDVDSEAIETPVGTSIAGDVIDVLTDEGWVLYDLVVWNKGFNQAGLRDQEFPFPESRLNNFAEAVVVLKKPGERDVSEERRQQSKIIRRDSVADHDLRDNVWRISPASWEPTYTESADTAQFPEELARRCILHWSYVGDTVLDPFCGRGTTLKVAKQLYRESIGYEIQADLEADIREYVGITGEIASN